MTRIRNCLLALAAALLPLTLVLPTPAQATLPPVVDGQPLPSLAPMLKRVTPAVVNISSKNHVRAHDPFLDDPFFRRFFGLPAQPREYVQQSLGSGVIVDAEHGYIITNNHVIEDADAITVALQDGRKFEASVVGADPATDLAVIRIDADDLMELPVADSSDLRVGDFVVAVGEPFGFGQTVTSGIVSALGRTGLGDTYQNFIQTDASINPGNSGGALVNLAGRLVGINSMIYSPSGTSAGIGFAIPSNLALHVMQQLVRYGYVRRGVLGVQTQNVTPKLARALGIDQASGAVVTHVKDNSAASRAGLRRGDVIIAIDDRPIENRAQLDNAEGLLPLDRDIQLTLWRQGKKLSLTARLAPEAVARIGGADIDPRLAGANLRDLTKHQRDTGSRGVQITAVAADSRAGSNGLHAEDRIVAVGRARVRDIKDLSRLLATPPRRLVLTIVRDGHAYYLPMQ